MKRLVLVFFVMLAVGVLFASSDSWAEQKKMKLAIASWNVKGDPNSKVLEAIAADLERATGGSVMSDISFRALGKGSIYYDAVANGICDIAYVPLAYTPERFPFSEILGFPIHYPNNVITAKAHYALWKKGYLDKQFEDVHVISLGTMSPYNFYWSKKPVTTLKEFQGKKIRTPGGPWSKIVDAIGGVPVNIPAGECYMAIERGTVDGVFWGWPAMPVFKLHEVVYSMTEVNMCGFPFGVFMNKKTYKKLPDKAKAVLNNNTEKYSVMMGEVHSGFNKIGEELYAKANRKTYKLSETERAKMGELIKPLFQTWTADMEAKGLKGEEVLKALHTILQDLGVKDPFFGAKGRFLK